VVLYSFSLVISFLYIFSNLYYNQINLDDFKSIEGIFLVAAKFTVDRYEENTTLPIYIKIQLSFVFFSNSIGGLLYGLSPQKKYLLCFLPPVIISLVFTEKAGIFFCSAAWISSYFIVRIILDKILIFNFKTFVRILIFGLVIIVIITASSFARLGTVELSELIIVKEKLYSGFGHIPAFSNWLSSYQYTDLTAEFGKYTISGILDFIGLSKREIGLYAVNYQLSNGTLTNIYSIHKGLILDYSIFGTILIYFLFGIFSSFFYYSVRQKKSRYIASLSLTYFLIIGSIFTSILVYNTIFLSCIFTIIAFSLINIEKA
jgi:oligosaccharide repeat unit polymerase